MKDNEIEFGKYYELDCKKKYFSIDLQREVQFDGVLAVKPTHKSDSACGNFNGGCLWFGTIVNVDVNGFHDYDTNNEIEFVEEDVISEYEFKDRIFPFIVPIKTKKERLDFLNKQLGTSYASLDDIDWTYVSYHYKLSENFIREFSDMVDWPQISVYQKLSEDFMREFKYMVNWCGVSIYQNLSEDFIREFKDEFSLSNISIYQTLSEDFIREFKDDVNWSSISKYQKLSEGFIREFKDNVAWYLISINQKLSEDFMREFKDELVWSNISIYQKLSEDFIREFHDEVDWDGISKYQKLSEDFIREFHDKVDWNGISKYQKLSFDFIMEFKDNLDLELIENNWVYKDANFLKKQVEDTGLYECHDDYFIAYKGIRSDRYSKYNFIYKYLPGETYESFCDCSSNTNSFGLSVWTEDNARKYSYELVVKVKVRYEDVGRVTHNGGKIRCRRITILT